MAGIVLLEGCTRYQTFFGCIGYFTPGAVLGNVLLGGRVRYCKVYSRRTVSGILLQGALSGTVLGGFVKTPVVLLIYRVNATAA